MPGEPTRAVFLSYASQDAEAARRICEALRAAGVEVWFDQSELRGGDAWDQKIRRQIRECALFVPVISMNTQARPEGYFRLEWRLADQRTHLMGKSKAFLVPVCIDDTGDADVDVPDSFLAVQWMRLAGGVASDAFAARVQALLRGEQVRPNPAGAPVAPAAPERREAPLKRAPSARRPAGWTWVAAAVLGLAATGLGAWFLLSPREPAPATTSRPGVAGPRGEAADLAARALAVCEKTAYTREELVAAEDMTRRATDLDSGSARAWAIRALVHATFVLRTWDRSPQRRQQSESFARRALALNPDEIEARVALCYLWNAQSAFANAETMTREILRMAPGNRRATGALSTALFAQRRAAEAQSLLQRHLDRDPDDVVIRYILGRSYVVGAGGATPANVTQALRHLDAAIALRPIGNAVAMTIVIHGCWRGDLAAMRAALARMEMLPPFERTEDMPFYWALYGELLDRQPERVLPIAALTARPYLEHWDVAMPRAWGPALAHGLAGRPELARREWLAAEGVLRERLKTTPDALREQLQLAITLAQLDRRDEAAAVLKAVAPLLGESNPRWLACYHASLGDAARAVPHLRAALNTMPHITDHTLPRDPWWDKIRGQPEFEALLAEAKARVEAGRPPPGANRTGSLSSAASIPAKSIAVLAFRQLGADPENEYLCEAISDELCNVLGRVPGLKVAASASAFSFKGKRVRPSEMAAQLGVAYLVDGSVQKTGSRIRVRAELLKASDESTVWKSDTLEHEVKDIFAVQDAVVGAIARNLQLQLGAGAPVATVVNPEAFRLYHEARRAWSGRAVDEEVQRARQLYHETIALDPGFGRAYAGLADVAITDRTITEYRLAWFGHRDTKEWREALAWADKAIQLEPGSAEVLATRGRVLWVGWRIADGERELRRAIALNPNYADARLNLARLLHADGRMDEALQEVRRAVEIDPLTSRTFDNYSLMLGDVGRFSEALVQADRALALQPNSRQATRARMLALSGLGRHDEALAIARRPEFSDDFLAAVALARAGFQADAMKINAAMQRNVAAQTTGLAAAGQRAEALRVLDPDRVSILAVGRWYYWSEFDSLRSEPRFVQTLEKIGLKAAHDRAQVWRAANPAEKPRSK